jgi:hypothetical protein
MWSHHSHIQTAANASELWWACGEFSPERAMATCAAVPACHYIARHESANPSSTGGVAVHLDPIFGAKGCVNTTVSTPACPDPALPMLWFFFNTCTTCGGRDFITPADGWVDCSAPNSTSCGGHSCHGATGPPSGPWGNMRGTGAEYWMWSGSPTWRKKKKGQG